MRFLRWLLNKIFRRKLKPYRTELRQRKPGRKDGR